MALQGGRYYLGYSTFSWWLAAFCPRRPLNKCRLPSPLVLPRPPGAPWLHNPLYFLVPSWPLGIFLTPHFSVTHVYSALFFPIIAVLVTGRPLDCCTFLAA